KDHSHGGRDYGHEDRQPQDVTQIPKVAQKAYILIQYPGRIHRGSLKRLVKADPHDPKQGEDHEYEKDQNARGRYQSDNEGALPRVGRISAVTTGVLSIDRAMSSHLTTIRFCGSTWKLNRSPTRASIDALS